MTPSSCARPATSSPRSSARSLAKRRARRAEVEVPRGVPGVRPASWCGSRARPNHYCVNVDCRGAARRSASCTSPAAARWTSRAWARSACASSSTPGSSTTRGDVYSLTVEHLVPLERMAPVSAQKLVDAHRRRRRARVSPGSWSVSASATSGPPPRKPSRVELGHPRPHRVGDRRGAHRGRRRRSDHRRERHPVLRDRRQPRCGRQAARGRRRPHGPTAAWRCQPRTPRSRARRSSSRGRSTGSRATRRPPRSTRAAARSPGACRRRRRYVLAGESPGTKLAKAEQLGVEVIDESRFRELLAP